MRAAGASAAAPLARVYVAYRLPAYGTDEWYAADLLSSVLTGGRSSPMYRDLVHQRQLVQDVGAFALPTELAGSFMLVATAKPDVDPAAVEEAVRAHLARAASAVCAPADLERARNRLLTSHWEALQQLDQRADQLSQLTTYFDDPRLLTRELERYATLDAEALRRTAATWLPADAGVTLTVVPARAASGAPA